MRRLLVVPGELTSHDCRYIPGVSGSIWLPPILCAPPLLSASIVGEFLRSTLAGEFSAAVNPIKFFVTISLSIHSLLFFEWIGPMIYAAILSLSLANTNCDGRHTFLEPVFHRADGDSGVTIAALCCGYLGRLRAGFYWSITLWTAVLDCPGA